MEDKQLENKFMKYFEDLDWQSQDEILFKMYEINWDIKGIEII
jgi:hypothetical protein